MSDPRAVEASGISREQQIELRTTEALETVASLLGEVAREIREAGIGRCAWEVRELEALAVVVTAVYDRVRLREAGQG